jgi:anthraniloyl-CoA monooxygenase
VSITPDIARRIACIGAGPAGLYFAILAKKTDPARHIDVFERNAPNDNVGWGIVFSDQTLETLHLADADTHAAIEQAFHHSDNVDVHYRDQHVRSTGHGFSGIARARLLDILRQRALALGVILHTESHFSVPEQWSGYDLVVAADGVHSKVREHYREHFRPQIETGKNRFIWLGTTHKFDTFAFDFRNTEWGWFVLHGYRYDNDASTVIVETSEENWRRAGLDRCSTEETLAFCERLFADCLGGDALMANPQHRSTSQWVRFERLHCKNWFHDNIVLLGDAAHTAHFSIGAGTRMAMEDAIALSGCIDHKPTIREALACYQTLREPEALKIVNAARNRQRWFENVARYTQLDPLQFTYSLFTGSQRISHSNLRLRDPLFTTAIETSVARSAGVDVSPAPPPMFTPFRLRDVTLPNRVVVSPMAMYSCKNGLPGDFHLAHLGERALGGAGLVMSEATYASPEGRITSACTGLWSDAHEAAWKHIVDFIHANSHAKIGIQLGHAGPKGSTPAPDKHVGQPDTASWPLLAASALPYDAQSQVPRAMSSVDMTQIKNELVTATQRAARAGFDVLELHCAHGYLLSSFLSPLTNHRNDEYGGSLENRLRYPLDVFSAMRTVWPLHKPMFVRISAHDWALGGNTDDDAVVIATAFKAAGADLIDVSSGQTTPLAKPVYGRMYQTPFADRIRNEVGIACMAVGNIFEHDHVNSIIAAGRADLCAIARPHLADPHWTLRAAAAQGYRGLPWPTPYERAKTQFESHVGGSGAFK